ncbi:hypothetical protein An12g08915 [Aspergillus niger]|uniref:Uncharacterized protein n=2 Tax=Aspergillus niger TaxID=5061 RepID=A2R0K4_ASPNC|nr:hypothetical protein An12g08915 [Aspergillus niger]CAK41342.1 hypothetical protein An12g08915 [Aspergillus niger]
MYVHVNTSIPSRWNGRACLAVQLQLRTSSSCPCWDNSHCHCHKHLNALSLGDRPQIV